MDGYTKNVGSVGGWKTNVLGKELAMRRRKRRDKHTESSLLGPPSGSNLSSYTAMGESPGRHSLWKKSMPSSAGVLGVADAGEESGEEVVDDFERGMERVGFGRP